MTVKLFQNPRTKKIFFIILAIAVVASLTIIITFIVIWLPDLNNGGS